MPETWPDQQCHSSQVKMPFGSATPMPVLAAAGITRHGQGVFVKGEKGRRAFGLVRLGDS